MTAPGNHERRAARQIETALRVVADVADEVAKGHPADAALARIFRAHPEFGSRDRRQYSHAVYAYFRWRGWTQQPGVDAARTVAWSIALDDASTAEWIERWSPVAGIDPANAARLTHAPLDAKAASLATWAGIPAPPPNALMPDWVGRYFPDPPAFHAFIGACQKRPPTWLRVPPDTAAALQRALTESGASWSTHPHLSDAIAVEPPFQLQLLEKACGAALQVQDLASQAVGAVCAAKRDERWWDACSGSGGKTLSLAEKVGPTGRVLATDVRSTILDNLAIRASAHGLRNIDRLVLDAAADAPRGLLFDGILVDAPCSGLGTWPRNPDARWRTAPDTPDAKAELQGRILRNAARAVRPGGRLIYSVCSVTRNEGPGVVARFLDAHPGYVRQSFMDPLNGRPCDGERTIQSGEGPCDGMYIACLVRSADKPA